MNPKPAMRPLSAGLGTVSPKGGSVAGTTLSPAIDCENITNPMLLLKMFGS